MNIYQSNRLSMRNNVGVSDFLDVFLNIKKTGIVLIMVCFSLIGFSQAKPDKNQAEINKLEGQLKTAQVNLSKAVKQDSTADALIESGTNMIKEAATEAKTNDAEQKRLDKEYANQTKLLNKKIGGKDKDAATEAKNDLKALDLKYKADIKDLAAKKKATDKKKVTGDANLTKGKTAKKAAAAPLKLAQTNVSTIEQKIDALKNGGNEGEGKKKKK
jgi:hypothetical protein